MKALFRTSLLFFVGTATSKWLAIIGGVLLLLSTVTIGLLGPLGLIFLLATPSMFGGTLLRILAAPVRAGTIPHYRTTVLLAGLCALLVAAGIIVLFAFLAYHLGAPPVGKPEADYALLFAVIFAFGTALWGMLFWASSSPFAMLGLVLGVFPAAALIPAVIDWFGYDPKQLLVFFKQTDHLFWTCVAIWSAFSIWFVRAPIIRQIDLANNPMLFNHSAAPLRQCKEQPLAMMLSPLAEFQRRRQYIMFPVLIIAIAAGVLSSNSDMLQGMFGGMAVGWTFTPVMIGAIVARRAKLLWLRAGNRDQLFNQGERILWRQTTPLNIFLSLILLIVALLPAATPDAPHLSATQCVSIGVSALIIGSCWLYLGMAFTQWNVRNFGLGLLTLIVTLSLLVVAIKGWSRTGLFGLLLAAIALAYSLRTLAQHRWRNMDWLITKPGKSGFLLRTN